MAKFFIKLILILYVLVFTGPLISAEHNFNIWLENFKKVAKSEGVSEATIKDTLENINESISLKNRMSYTENQLSSDITLIKNILKSIPFFFVVMTRTVTPFYGLYIVDFARVVFKKTTGGPPEFALCCSS